MRPSTPSLDRTRLTPGVRTLAGLLVTILLASTLPAQAEAASTLPPLGMNTSSIKALTEAGAPPRYASYWVTSGVASHGWGGLENALRSARASDTTPVIYWYYWGDSISPHCVEHGCDGRSRAQWTSLTATLGDKIRAEMGGREVLVVLENEFNKGGITGSYAPTFDAYLEAVAKQLRSVSGVRLVLGFGAWVESDWTKFSKSAAQSHYIGFQMMRASTRDTEAQYRAAAPRIEDLTSYVAKTFHKPAFLYDLALSSYPDAKWARIQAETLDAVFDSIAVSGQTGLQGVVYRSLLDVPTMGLHNYYGEAERHWGLKTSSGVDKPAWSVWQAKATGGTSPSFSATFSGVKVEEWWVQTSVSANKAISKVDARINGGSWIALDKQSWGGYAKSLNVKSGDCVEFRASATDGASVVSPRHCRGSSLSATFSGVKVEEWWVQTSVSASKPLAKVEARINGGPWQTLDVKSYGHAKSIHVKTGQCVEFRASASDGTSATSSKHCRAAHFSATFSGVKVQEWWVQASVKGDMPLSHVDVRVNGGAWIRLDDKGWGHTKSVNVKTGQSVEFRGTATDGSTAVSQKFWR